MPNYRVRVTLQTATRTDRERLGPVQASTAAEACRWVLAQLTPAYGPRATLTVSARRLARVDTQAKNK